VPQSNTLKHAIVGFSRETGRVVTIPAGATVSTMIPPSGIGVSLVEFQGNKLLVSCEDIDRYGLTDDR